MNVPDLPTLNTVLSGCCCALPTCGEATVLCQSLTRTSYCANDDYTDALAAKAYYDAQVIAHATWVTEHATWVTDKAAYDACYIACTEPCTDPGAEPVEPVVPANPGTPTEPAGYDDVEHGCYAPFEEPAGGPDERIPTIYRTLATLSVTGEIEGEYYHYYTIGTDTEFLDWRIYAAGTSTDYATANSIVDEVCGSESVTPSFGANEFDWTYTAPTCVVTATTRVAETLGSSASGTVPLALVGCPGPWADTVSNEAWDVTITDRLTYTLGEGITPSSLITRASGKIPAWPDEAEGSTCVASTVVVWPTERDLYVGVDPEADPPEAGSWPTCDDLEFGPLSAGGSGDSLTRATTTKVRYKVGIPTYMQAHRLWIIAHAEWDIEHTRWIACGSDPETEPAEPVEPVQLFTYFAVQWDILDVPHVWEAWRILYDEWRDAVAAKAAWDACELLTPDECGPEPTVPADPSADQPDDRPEYVDEDLFWTFTGGETEAAQYSDWYTIDVPTRESERRMVNMQVKCWQSTRIGVPPTFYGETYNVDDYPA